MKKQPLPSKSVEFKLALADVERGMSIVDACRENYISRPTYYKLRKRFEDEGEPGLRGKLSAPKNTRKMDEKLSQAIRKIVFLNPTLSAAKIIGELSKIGFSGKSRSTIYWYLNRLGILKKKHRYQWIEIFYKGKEKDLNDVQMSFLCSMNSCYRDLRILNDIDGVYFQSFLLDIGPEFIDDRYLYLVINAATGFADFVSSDIKNDGLLMQPFGTALQRQNQKYVKRIDVVSGRIFFDDFKKKTRQINSRRPAPEIHQVSNFLSLGMATRCRVWILEYVKGRSGFKKTDEIANAAIMRWNSTIQNNFPLYGRAPIFAG